MNANTGALKGLRVIDASRVLGGPFCGQILGDHGAEVLKIEIETGDDTRQWGPPYMGHNSAYFSGANRNKRSRVLDLSSSDGRQAFFELLSDTDILVENFKESTLKKWGLHTGSFTQSNPKLIHCRVSGFGSDGPYGGLPAYDTAIQAQCGLMSVNGDNASGPMRVGLPIVDMTTGLNATIGILLALHDRELTGKGQIVETTLFASAISLLHPHSSNYFSTGKSPIPTGNAHPNIYPYDSFRTATGMIYLAIGNDTQFVQFCRHLELDSLSADPLYATNPARSTNREQLRTILQTALQDTDGNQLTSELIRLGVPCAPIKNVQEVLEDPHTLHQNLIVKLDPGYTGIASPISLSRTPASYRLAPPRLPSESGEPDDVR
ncbi:carnitine dehydratase [Advenella kashmirensis W13003]|uniref:Carnitine dehydratase n=1 Tax=Advenella kashmirensis W13003 TaxID=1424334 RepID=V8QX12_9BURK|nr:CaiB/BaiF CoA-transferase family protein [Advenella kashmirensis]ETF04466.1 carnitine dehydratase [Advenella kashmirensis W13003]